MEKVVCIWAKGDLFVDGKEYKVVDNTIIDEQGTVHTGKFNTSVDVSRHFNQEYRFSRPSTMGVIDTIMSGQDDYSRLQREMGFGSGRWGK